MHALGAPARGTTSEARPQRTPRDTTSTHDLGARPRRACGYPNPEAAATIVESRGDVATQTRDSRDSETHSHMPTLAEIASLVGVPLDDASRARLPIRGVA